MSAVFSEAFDVRGHLASEKYFLFAGRPVRIRIIGRQLAEHIFLPFSHLQVDQKFSEHIQLTIDIWDESETGLMCREPLEPEMEYRTVTASSDSRFLNDQDQDMLVSIDRKSHRMVGAFQSAEKLVDRSKPLNRLLSLWYKDRGIPIIHSGLAADRDNGVLMAAGSGAGKSTLATMCVKAGFDFFSDDQVGLEMKEDGSFLGHSLYNSVRLKPDQLKKIFPEFLKVSFTDRYRDDKSVVFLSEVLPNQVCSTIPIRLLVLPQVIQGQTTRIYPTSKGDALSVLVSSSILTILGLDQTDLDKMAALVKKIPIYRIDLGTRFEEAPSLIRKVLSEVTS